jgi:putative endonuclease
MDKSSYIYMMGNASRRSLYAGVCAWLEKRVWEHKNGLGGAVTKKYNCDRLVYFERFSNIEIAIAREKKLRAGDVPRKTSSSSPSIPIGKTWLPTGTQMNCFLMASQ